MIREYHVLWLLQVSLALVILSGWSSGHESIGGGATPPSTSHMETSTTTTATTTPAAATTITTTTTTITTTTHHITLDEHQRHGEHEDDLSDFIDMHNNEAHAGMI